MRFKNWKKPILHEGKLTKWNWMVQNVQNLKLGNHVDVGAFTYINAKFLVTIEDNVEIGSHCSIYSHSSIDTKNGPIILKKNCKIGTHSVIMPNVTVGENSIVAAFSFVNKNIPPNVVVGGVPAKLIKKLKINKTKS